MNIELWKLVASIGLALIGAVTAPIIWAIRAEVGKLRAEIKLDLEKMDKSLRLEMKDITVEMAAMEKRLNERIDTRLVHR